MRGSENVNNMEEKKNRKPPVKKLFTERLRREGRWQEFSKAVADLSAAEGCVFNVAFKRLMPQYGFESAKEEWKHFCKYLRENGLDPKGFSETGIPDYEFFRALDTLPANAPVSVEINWILAHSAMLRFHRGSGEAVRITESDILHATHGPAPSRQAVIKLQHWANHPDKFFQQVLTEDKKQIEQAEDVASETKEDFSDIHALLEEVKGKPSE